MRGNWVKGITFLIPLETVLRLILGIGHNLNAHNYVLVRIGIGCFCVMKVSDGVTYTGEQY